MKLSPCLAAAFCAFLCLAPGTGQTAGGSGEDGKVNAEGYVPRKYPKRKTGNGILASGNPRLKEIAITIDDGPHPAITPKILAILKEKKVKVTFFAVGKMMVKSPDLIRRMVDDGHIVGNHSYTHPRLDAMSDDDVRKEIRECSEAFYKITGMRMGYVRPPGMRANQETLRIFRNMDLCLVDWTDIAGDFIVGNGTRPDPEKIAERATSKIHNGSILLLHDSEETAQVLGKIIDAIRSKGFKMVTVEEMRTHL